MPVILVIDDNPQMAELIQEMVQLAGYEAAVAYSGLEGLDRARVGMPDLILVDVMMPDLDGWQVYQKLREFSTIPVIFVTMHNTPENQAKAEALGADGLLGKDVTPLQLAQQIQFVLESQKEPRKQQKDYLH